MRDSEMKGNRQFLQPDSRWLCYTRCHTTACAEKTAP